jgi:hypothetical protein
MANTLVEGETTTVSFACMHSGAKYMLKIAEESNEGQLYTLVASLIFSAFTLEAYLNHLGKLRNREWDEIERKYPKLEKYKLFATAANITVDFNVRPYCTLKELFEFRDRMAHGKTTTEPVSTYIEEFADRLPQLLSENGWQAFAKFETALRSIKDVEDLIRELHLSSGYTGNPFNNLGGGVYGGTEQSA